jgi:hypothetical protein
MTILNFDYFLSKKPKRSRIGKIFSHDNKDLLHVNLISMPLLHHKRLIFEAVRDLIRYIPDVLGGDGKVIEEACTVG